ncbi:hypothetical protein N431DRAFT_450654 [Stipitochalara longipes BDJ]|nr:hypothetical protein N431DRAFT_450654 [Stipitochalara longipes BDJ]
MTALSTQFRNEHSTTLALHAKLQRLEMAFTTEQTRCRGREQRIWELEDAAQRRERESMAREVALKAKHMRDREAAKQELSKARKESKELRNELAAVESARDEVETSMVVLRVEHGEEMQKVHARNESHVSKLVAQMVVFALLVTMFHSTSMASLKKSRAASRSDLASLRFSYLEALLDCEQLLEQQEVSTQKRQETLSRLNDFEHKLPDLEAGTEYAAIIRRGFLRTGRGGAANHEFIKARNRAAHDGDLKLDQALIRLGYLSPEEIAFCDERYGVDTQQYVGSPRQTEVCNIHACIETELMIQKDLKRELEEPLVRFHELEHELWEFRSMLARTGAGEEKIQEAFEANVDTVQPIIEEMRDIVKLFQKAKKREAK